MSEIDGDPDPLYTFGHPKDLLGPLAEELPDPDHVFKAGKYTTVRRNLPDPDQGLFLKRPGLFREEFSHR